MRLSTAAPWLANGVVVAVAIAQAKQETERRRTQLAELPEEWREQVVDAIRNAQPSHVPLLRELEQVLSTNRYAASAAVVRERIAEVENP